MAAQVPSGLPALVNRAEDLERAALGLLRAGRTARYVAGWVAAWPVASPGSPETAALAVGREYARGRAAGLLAVERNAARGGRL